GTLQVTEATHRLVAPLFEAEGPFPVEVKGKSEPVQAHRVLRVKETPGALRGIEGLRAPLIGRGREMDLLRRAVEELLQGRGQVISVMGEAGLGKSRLIAELRQRLLAEGVLSADGEAKARWLEGRSVSYASTTPYTPLVELFTACFGLRSQDTNREKYEKLRAHVSALLPDRILETAPFIATLLGIGLEGEELERVKYLNPPQVRERTFTAVRAFIERVAVVQPLVLVFEDLHWIDPTSLDLVQQLMAITDRVPLMLVGVFRPWRQEPSWRFHEAATRDFPHRYTAVELEPLGEEESRSLVSSLLHIEDLPEKVRALILKKAEGNPFFVEEVIRSLLDARLVVRENSHWRATREIADIAVPDTLAGVINARLDRLDEATRRVAQTAAVIGREFPFDTLAQVAQESQSLEDVLTELQRRDLVRERSRRPQRVYTFKHALTQEAAYASLLMSRRREIHRRVAESLEALAPERVNDIARHFIEAREQARALPYLVAAGERAAFACSLEDALAFFKQAVDILESVPDGSLARRAYDGLGGALALAFDVQGAVDTFHKMIHVAETYDDLPMKVSAFNKLARVTGLMQGQFPEAEEHLREAERLAMLCQDVPGLTELHMSYCALRTISGDIEGALEHQKQAIQIGNVAQAAELRLFGMSHCAASLTYLTHFDEALAQARTALAAAEQAGNRLHMTWPSVLVIPWYYLRLGDMEAACQEARKGTELAMQIGAEDAEGCGAFMLGHMARLQGRYEEAIAWQQRAIGAARASGLLFLEAGGLAALGSLHLEISEKNQAQSDELHAQASKMMDNPFGLVLAAQSWTDMGFEAITRDRADEAQDLFQKALTQRSTFRYLVRPAALVGSALASRAQGSPEEAHRLIGEARAFAEERKMRLYYPLIALGEARIAASDGGTDASLQHFAQAEALAREMQMRPLLWQAQAGAARLLASLGRDAEAEEKRREAQAVIA
ncbi:MAG: AAA family ATPase, partial [Chloroflexi bacterium]|nr:AAA family ATPase [Chloroflexota bacterium]